MRQLMAHERKDMVSTTIWLSKADMEALSTIANKTRISKALLIREGISRTLKSYRMLLDREIEINYGVPEIVRRALNSEEK